MKTYLAQAIFRLSTTLPCHTHEWKAPPPKKNKPRKRPDTKSLRSPWRKYKVT